MQNVPILNDHVDMRPILNGNLSIHSIHSKPKKGPISFEIVFTHPVPNGPESDPWGIFALFRKLTILRIFLNITTSMWHIFTMYIFSRILDKRENMYVHSI